MKKYILIHFEIQKKLIVVGLFLLLAGFRGPQANFTGRSLSTGSASVLKIDFPDILPPAAIYHVRIPRQVLGHWGVFFACTSHTTW
jgi:hypothetical protein